VYDRLPRGVQRVSHGVEGIQVIGNHLMVAPAPIVFNVHHLPLHPTFSIGFVHINILGSTAVRQSVVE
jgi:hypothetical protein